MSGLIEDIFLQMFYFRNRLFVYRRILMVGTKSCSYLNSGACQRDGTQCRFFCTRPSPNFYTSLVPKIYVTHEKPLIS